MFFVECLYTLRYLLRIVRSVRSSDEYELYGRMHFSHELVGSNESENVLVGVESTDCKEVWGAHAVSVRKVFCGIWHGFGCGVGTVYAEIYSGHLFGANVIGLNDLVSAGV